MKNYICRVSDKNGKILKLLRKGSTPSVIQSELQNEGYFPVSIMEKGGADKRGTFKKRVISASGVAEFTALFSMLLNSGLSTRDSLEILKTITKDKKVNYMVSALERELEGGASFYSGIKNIGSVLPEIYLSMVRVGERTGDLGFVFKKINYYLVRQKKIREKIVSSLIYPVIVLVVALLSIVLISTFIIPKMSEIFDSFGSGIPPEVRQALLFSKGFFTFLIISLPLVLILGFLLSFLCRRDKKAAVIIDRLKLKIPFSGSFSKNRVFLDILFTLDALTSCGVTVEDALFEVAETGSNRAFREAFKRVHFKVLKGVELSEALSDEDLIPENITKWIAVGERTGRMGEVFKQLSDYYENELEKKSIRFMSLIEPALIIITGGIVFGIVILIIIPLYSTFGTLLE